MGNTFRDHTPKPPACNTLAECEAKKRRTWNTLVREPWNPVIKASLNAIDLHIAMYIREGDPWHLDQAEYLREYVVHLKDWIVSEEGKTS